MFAPILAGILSFAPGSQVEWHEVPGGWRCVVLQSRLLRGVVRTRIVASAVDRTGIEAAVRVLGRLWAAPETVTRGRRA